MSAIRFSTGRLAAGCGRRPRLAIGLWLAIAAISLLVVSRLLSGALTNEFSFTNNPDSQQVKNLLSRRLHQPEKIDEVVIVSSKQYTVDQPQFFNVVKKLGGDIIGLGPGLISGGISYYQTHNQSMVSADRHTTIIPLVMSGTLSEAEKNVTKLQTVLSQNSRASGFRILTTGTASSNNDFNHVSETDLQKAELIGIPIALVILVFVFGTLVAASLPLILAGFSIVIALCITALVGQLIEMSFFVENMITMMGLAVGIDYSLFVISRYREELSRGSDRLQAIRKAGDTASRAVLFSGMTVILALVGMLIIPLNIFYSLAAGAMFVVAVSVLAALTLLPAVLSLLGPRINSLKIPLIHRYQAGNEAEQGSFWNTVAHTVMRRPVISLLAVIIILGVPAVFYFQIKTGANGIAVLPDSYTSKQGYQVLTSEFSFGLTSPAEVAVLGNVNLPAVMGSVSKLEQEVKKDKVFYGTPSVTKDPAANMTLVTMPVSGAPESAEATGAIRRLREQYVPQAFRGVNARVLVGGIPAMELDYFNITNQYRPIVFAFVLGLSFLLLMLVFHSVVVPLKAVFMNLLSVGAAYGLIVIVFQKGVGAGLFGFRQVSSVEAWVPLFLFSVLFGLSMDYHVFLLGRIKEHYNRTGDNSASVAIGLRFTGRIITGAALIMVAVFSGFASGQLVMFQQMGFGLGVAILLDATLVRSILVPAAMKLLGDRNWYLPRWLRWMPDFGIGSE
ncbi:MAG: MMPL family transporter [Actinobacteria bacterium]|nr:MMPL family transporter [Actinomycetota bacterium]